MALGGRSVKPSIPNGAQGDPEISKASWKDPSEDASANPSRPARGSETNAIYCYSRNTLTAAAMGNWVLCRRMSAST